MAETQTECIDTGDVVLHTPTGEEWLVACVRGDRLSWCGWPEGMADLADCTLVRKATAKERHSLLAEMAHIGDSDHRGRYARDRLATEEFKDESGGSNG
jgi:hypothetical protein